MDMQKIMNQIKWGLLIFLVVSFPTDVLFAQSVTVIGCGDDGTLEAVFHALNTNADLENLSIDSTSVKAHPQSA